MTVPQALLAFVLVWLAVVAIGHLIVIPFLRRSPGRTPLNGLLWWVVRGFTRVWHRLRSAGREILPSGDGHGGLIVVSNHTGALDPLIIQAGCPFLIRWMMASDMMTPHLDWLWRDEYIIPVDRDAPDSRSLREAIRYVKDGGAIGIFPEGRITMPPREIRPFLAGVGLMISRTKAPVLLVWVSGTPDTNKLGESLGTRSHAHVEFVEMRAYDGKPGAAEITEHLRERLAEVSGWPLNDEMIPIGGPDAKQS